MCNRNEKNACKEVSRERERETLEEIVLLEARQSFHPVLVHHQYSVKKDDSARKIKAFSSSLGTECRFLHPTPCCESRFLPRLAFASRPYRVFLSALFLDLSSRELLKGKQPRNPFSTKRQRSSRGKRDGGGNSRILVARGSRHRSRRAVDKDKCRKRKKITYYYEWRRAHDLLLVKFLSRP